LLLVAFLLVNAPNSHLSLLLASAATCVLSNSTYELSISTDMITDILITKLRAKFLTESHWHWIFCRLKHVTYLNLISFLTI